MIRNSGTKRSETKLYHDVQTTSGVNVTGIVPQGIIPQKRKLELNFKVVS